MQSPFHIIIRSGPRSGQAIALEKEEFVVGRDTGNDLVLEDPEVSRRHARLFRQGSGYWIEDLGSTNGTSVNNQRLSGPRSLANGDVITLGEHTNLSFEGVPPDQAATIAAQAFHIPDEPQPPAYEPRQAPPPPVMSPPPATARPAPSYPPQPAYIPPPQPSYPAHGFETPVVEEAPPRRRMTSLTLILLILVGCLLLACIVFAVIDTLNLYCTLFPGIVNLFVPGYCP